ncbi:MAG: hypothetical protein HDQ88_07045 [Clostridia bacterium]|nr:hypothetical protein [Clostridia bacterium]
MNNIINDGVLLHLDISIWTGKARLMRSDVPQAADKLPSEELISLGSKKIFDPEKLRAFGTLKSRAVRTCEQYGSRLMGGYLVDGTKLAELEAELDVIQTEWEQAVGNLVNDYDVAAAEWLKEHAEWAQMLRQSLPTPPELLRKYNFSWQTYKIEPVMAGPMHVGNTTEQEIQSMPDKILAEVAEECQNIYNVSFAGGRATRRAFNAIAKLADRCEALSFTSPYAAQACTVLRDVVNTESLPTAAFTLQSMSDVAKLQTVLDAVQQAGSVSDWAFLGSQAAEPEKSSLGELIAKAQADYVEAVGTPQEKTTLSTVSLVAAAQEALAKPAATEPETSGVLDSLGLW